MRHSDPSAEDLTRIHDEHLAIVRAVGDQNGDRARQLVASHLQTSQRERLAEFDRWQREASLEAGAPAFLDPFRTS